MTINAVIHLYKTRCKYPKTSGNCRNVYPMRIIITIALLDDITGITCVPCVVCATCVVCVKCVTYIKYPTFLALFKYLTYIK